MDVLVRNAVATDADRIAAAHVEGWRVGYRGLVPDRFLDDPAFAAARRTGWGRILSGGMPEAERSHAALDDLCRHAVLWVLRDNRRARRFYERHGWSCGHAGELVEAQWPGPWMEGAPRFDEPVPEIRYRRRSGG